MSAPLVDRRVKIVGLSAKPELNGQQGRAIAFDAAAGRYTVSLDNGSTIRVRAHNLCADDGSDSQAPQSPGVAQIKAVARRLLDSGRMVLGRATTEAGVAVPVEHAAVAVGVGALVVAYFTGVFASILFVAILIGGLGTPFGRKLASQGSALASAYLGRPVPLRVLVPGSALLFLVLVLLAGRLTGGRGNGARTRFDEMALLEAAYIQGHSHGKAGEPARFDYGAILDAEGDYYVSGAGDGGGGVRDIPFVRIAMLGFTAWRLGTSNGQTSWSVDNCKRNFAAAAPMTKGLLAMGVASLFF